MINKTLVNKLETLWLSQYQRAGTIDLKKDPGNLQGVYEKAGDAIDRATTGLFKINRLRIGSWIKGQDLPLQLFSTKVLTVDLTIDELCKSKPYEVPLPSLIKMENQGLLYLNIRDYDSEKIKGFNQLCSGRAAENLDRILSECRNVYIGSALREPVFNACLSWEGLHDVKITEIQKDCYNDLLLASKAFDEEILNGNLANEKSFFRGEKFNIISISWNYAFLKSVRSKLDDYIFNDSLSEGRVGLDTQYAKAVHYGNLWNRSKSNEDRAIAARTFLEFSGETKTYHQLYTANITASWGSNYNLTNEEFNSVQSKAVSIRTKIDVQADSVWQRVIAGLYSQTIGIGARHFSSNEQIIYDEGKIDLILEMLVNRESEMKDIYAEIANYTEKYLKGKTYTRNDLVRLQERFSEMDNKYFNFLKAVFGKGVTLSLLKMVRGIELGASDFLKVDIKIDIPTVAKKILIPSPEKRMLFNIYMKRSCDATKI